LAASFMLIFYLVHFSTLKTELFLGKDPGLHGIMSQKMGISILIVQISVKVQRPKLPSFGVNSLYFSRDSRNVCAKTVFTVPIRRVQHSFSKRFFQLTSSRHEYFHNVPTASGRVPRHCSVELSNSVANKISDRRLKKFAFLRAGFFLGLLFNPEDGGYNFLRNEGVFHRTTRHYVQTHILL
jgi:hypothetical protein